MQDTDKTDITWKVAARANETTTSPGRPPTSPSRVRLVRATNRGRHTKMTVSWDDRDRILYEVIMNIPRSKSKVARSPEVDALRRTLERQVREMKTEGITPEPLKD